MSYWEDKKYHIELELACLNLERQNVAYELNHLTQLITALHAELNQVNLRLTQIP